MQSGNNVGTGLEAGTLSLASSESLNAIGSYLPLPGRTWAGCQPAECQFSPNGATAFSADGAR